MCVAGPQLDQPVGLDHPDLRSAQPQDGAGGDAEQDGDGQPIRNPRKGLVDFEGDEGALRITVTPGPEGGTGLTYALLSPISPLNPK